MSKSGKNRPSILNWMGTLILVEIPGVNLIFLILSAIFAKSAAKRNFAIAALLLVLLWVIVIFAAFALFPEYFAKLGQALREAGELVHFS